MSRQSKNRITNILFIALAVVIISWCVLVLPPSAVHAQTPVQVSLSAPASVSTNSDFTVRVNISLVTNFDAASYRVSFDSKTLRLNSVTTGQIGSRTIPIVAWHESPPGTCIVVQNLSGISGVTGSGYLATLSFHVIVSVSKSTTINLANVVLSNTRALPIRVNWSGDSLNIVAPSAPTPPATPSQELEKYPTPPPPAQTAPPVASPTPQQPAVSPPLQPVPKLAPRTASGGAEVINEKGVFTKDYNTESWDKGVKIAIAKNTAGQTADKKPLTGISMYKVAKPSAPASKHAVIGEARNFGPSGATFNPPITLTFTYSDKELPAGMKEKNLVLGYRDEKKAEWVVVKDSKLDADANTITARIDHFTTFAIIADITLVPAPVFSIADLKISPQEVSAGENVNIGALVMNKGDAVGDYDVTLMINGVLEKKQTLKIEAGQNQTVNFVVIRDVGKYSVDVNDLIGTFNVVRAKPSPAAPPSEPSEPQADKITGSTPGGMSWPWIKGVLELFGVAAVMVVLVYLVFRGKLI